MLLKLDNLKHHFAISDKWNLLYTVLIFATNFAYGISVTVVNSTMVDIGHIYSVSAATMSYMAICISIGYLIGSLASYLYRFINRQLGLICFLLLMALCTSLLPHYGHLWIVFIMMVLNGIGSGAWDSSVSIWLVEIWPKANAAILQANMFMSGIGSIVAPLMVANYVHGDANVTANNETLTIEMRIRDLSVPFSIEGVLQSIVPLIFLALFFIHRYTEPARSQPKPSFEQIEPNYESIPHRGTKLALLGIATSLSMAAEMGYIIFSSAMWQHLDIRLNAHDAAHVLSILTATYTAGRLASAFISLKLKPDFIISYHYAIVIGALTLLFFGRHKLECIYAGNALLGYGFSAMWPAMFAFTEQQLTLTPKVCSLYSFLSGAVTLIMPLVLGQVFDDIPIVVFLVDMIFVLVSLTLFVGVKLWIKRSL